MDHYTSPTSSDWSNTTFLCSLPWPPNLTNPLPTLYFSPQPVSLVYPIIYSFHHTLCFFFFLTTPACVSFAGSFASTSPLNVKYFLDPVIGLLLALLRYLGNLILSHGFQYHLHTDNILICTCSLDLSILLQTLILSCLIDTVIRLSQENSSSTAQNWYDIHPKLAPSEALPSWVKGNSIFPVSQI